MASGGSNALYPNINLNDESEVAGHSTGDSEEVGPSSLDTTSLPPEPSESPFQDSKPTGSEQRDRLPCSYTVEEAVEYAGCGWFQIKLVVILGLLLAADAMEMILLALLGPTLRCQWRLTGTQTASITTVVFVGFLFGAPFWGYLSDHLGRKPILFIVLSMIGYFGILTSTSPNLAWVLILRIIVGFAIGGCSSGFTLMSEFLPIKQRAKVLIFSNVFWAVGSCAEVGLAYLILPSIGWRWMVFISAIPMILFLILLKFIPESPRYLVGKHRLDEAGKVIDNLFRLNKVKPLEGVLVPSTTHVFSRSQIYHSLFGSQYLVTSLILPIIWFGSAFLYYGGVLISTEVPSLARHCSKDLSDLSNVHEQQSVHRQLDGGSSSCCQELSNDELMIMLISSLGEFMSIPLAICLIDTIGRRCTMAFWNISTGLMFLLLLLCMSANAMKTSLFVMRAFASGLMNICYVYTSEVYPTNVRAVSIGIFSSIARLGAMGTPFVAQVAIPNWSVLVGLVTYTVIGVVCGILAALLPIETRGRELPASVFN